MPINVTHSCVAKAGGTEWLITAAQASTRSLSSVFVNSGVRAVELQQL